MARTFNGTTQRLAYAAAIASRPFTIAVWFNLTSLTVTAEIFSILDNTQNPGLDGYALDVSGTEGGDPVRAWYQTNGGATVGYAKTTAGPAANTWTHGCGVFAAASTAAYINGGNKGNAGTNTATAPNSTNLGARFYGGAWSGFFPGRLAEAAIWDVALTDAEVVILAKGMSPLLMRPQSLVAYWPLIGRTSPEIELINGYGMSLVNAPTVGDHPPVLYPPRALFSHVVATPTTTTVQLDWTDVSENEDGFSIERATDAGAFAEIDTVGAGVVTYDDLLVPTGHTYHYRVRATSATLGYSDYSNEADVVV